MIQLENGDVTKILSRLQVGPEDFISEYSPAIQNGASYALAPNVGVAGISVGTRTKRSLSK